MLEKIKNLKAKGEILKALIGLADDESEAREHAKALKSVKNELLKMLENFEQQHKTQRAESREPKTQRNLDDILKENDVSDI